MKIYKIKHRIKKFLLLEALFNKKKVDTRGCTGSSQVIAAIKKIIKLKIKSNIKKTIQKDPGQLTIEGFLVKKNSRRNTKLTDTWIS